MRLVDLDPAFLRLETETRHRLVDSLEEAHGIWFLCPKCFTENGGPIGTHRVLCWFVGVSQEVDPKPGRWQPSGTGFHDLSFIGPGAASVQLTTGCRWHGFIRNGEVT